jgi:hypothetical protein
MTEAEFYERLLKSEREKHALEVKKIEAENKVALNESILQVQKEKQAKELLQVENNRLEKQRVSYFAFYEKLILFF